MTRKMHKLLTHQVSGFVTGNIVTPSLLELLQMISETYYYYEGKIQEQTSGNNNGAPGQ